MTSQQWSQHLRGILRMPLKEEVRIMKEEVDFHTTTLREKRYEPKLVPADLDGWLKQTTKPIIPEL